MTLAKSRVVGLASTWGCRQGREGRERRRVCAAERRRPAVVPTTASFQQPAPNRQKHTQQAPNKHPTAAPTHLGRDGVLKAVARQVGDHGAHAGALEALVPDGPRVAPHAADLGGVGAGAASHGPRQAHPAQRLLQRQLARGAELGAAPRRRQAGPGVELRGAQPRQRLAPVHGGALLVRRALGASGVGGQQPGPGAAVWRRGWSESVRGAQDRSAGVYGVRGGCAKRSCRACTAGRPARSKLQLVFGGAFRGLLRAQRSPHLAAAPGGVRWWRGVAHSFAQSSSRCRLSSHLHAFPGAIAAPAADLSRCSPPAAAAPPAGPCTQPATPAAAPATAAQPSMCSSSVCTHWVSVVCV